MHGKLPEGMDGLLPHERAVTRPRRRAPHDQRVDCKTQMLVDKRDGLLGEKGGGATEGEERIKDSRRPTAAARFALTSADEMMDAYITK